MCASKEEYFKIGENSFVISVVGRNPFVLKIIE